MAKEKEVCRYARAGKTVRGALSRVPSALDNILRVDDVRELGEQDRTAGTGQAVKGFPPGDCELKGCSQRLHSFPEP